MSWLVGPGGRATTPLHTQCIATSFVTQQARPLFQLRLSSVSTRLWCSCRSDEFSVPATIQYFSLHDCQVTDLLNLVYALHLANLVPLNVSTHRPHKSVIQGFLERASLPDEIIAFSACILDALSTRFAATWRDTLAPSDYARTLKNFLRTDSRQSEHVSPDVIVLAALALAHGFLADRQRSSRHWSVRESDGVFTVQEIEATKRAILEDMDYGLFRISEDRCQRRLRAMQLAVLNPAAALPAKDDTVVAKSNRLRNLSLSLSGTAIWSHGQQTPEPSP